MQLMKQLTIRICQGLCIIAVIASLATAAVAGMHSQSNTALAASGQEDTKPAAETKTAQSSTSLQSQLDSIVKEYGNLEVSVAAMDTSDNTYVTSGETAAFKAASITKVISACAYMHQVELGNASLATVIEGSAAQNLLQRMLTNSDNAAWAAINAYLGKDTIQTYANSLGLTSFDAYGNIITAHDQALFLSKFAKQALLNGTHTSLLKSFMQNTNNDELIPASVPNGAVVYHKYGYLDGYLHDSAIITYRGKTYTLVILTKSSTGTVDDYAIRTNLFHAVTQVVTSLMERS